MTQHVHTYRTPPASPEYRENWERIFGKKEPEYQYVTYPIEGADRSTAMETALKRSMEIVPGPSQPPRQSPARGIMGRDGT